MIVAAPGTSSIANEAPVDALLGRTRRAATRATAPMGPFTQKMNCQLVHVVMAPPSRTPTATPTLPTAPKRASPLLRCGPSYVVISRDSADGVSRAALS